MKNSSSRKGFTVVELVIVIAVIAVLAAVLIPTFSSLIKKANDSAYLQERTNQQIADLAEKVENQDFLSWEDLEAKLAEEIAKIEIPAGSDLTETQVKAAISNALANFETALKSNNTALTEDQVKSIVEKALEGQLTSAQVEAVVNAAIAKIPAADTLTEAQIKAVIDNAIAGLDKQTGITKEEMASAIETALKAQPGLESADVSSIINNALAGFGYGNDPSISDIKNIIDSAIAATKEDLTADEVAVKEMNDVLATGNCASLFDVYRTLEAEGKNARGYQSLTSDTMFFWDANLNRVLYVDSNLKVVAPADLAGKTYNAAKDTWVSLSQELFETKEPQAVAGYTSYKVSGYVQNGSNNVNVKITTKEELAFVFDYLNEEIAKSAEVLPKSYTIDLGGNVIDMMGASLSIKDLTAGTNGNHKSFTIKNGTIKNISLIEPTMLGDGQTPGGDGQYDLGFISNVARNMSLTIEGVDFYGIHVNNSSVGNVGLLIGTVNLNQKNSGVNKVVIKNVNIYDSSLLAHRSAGSLIGYSTGKDIIDLENIYMENVDVKTVGGRSAFLIGNRKENPETYKITASDIDLKDCSFSLYECAQNTGEGYGLTGTTLKSWCYDGTNEKEDKGPYAYYANALMITDNGSTDGSSFFAGSVTGWN